MKTWTTPINEAGAIERDATAHIAFLDAQKEVDTSKKIGTQGYCMGGPLVFKTAAAICQSAIWRRRSDLPWRRLGDG